VKTVKYEDNEIQALKELMHAGVKAIGLSSVHAASVLLHKLDEEPETRVTEPVEEKQS
jgi:hypothetical protein